MAAETLTSLQAASTYPVRGNGPAGQVLAAVGCYSIGAAVEDGDIFEMCKLPKGAVVIGGWIDAADIDTGTETLDMDIGWAANGNESADPDGFGNLGVWTGDASATKPEVSNHFALGGVLRTTGPQLFTAETTIQVEANAASNAGHTGMLTCVILYVMDPSFDAV